MLVLKKKNRLLKIQKSWRRKLLSVANTRSTSDHDSETQLCLGGDCWCISGFSLPVTEEAQLKEQKLQKKTFDKRP